MSTREIKFRLHDKAGTHIGWECHFQNKHGVWQIQFVSLRGDFLSKGDGGLAYDGYFIPAHTKVQFTGRKDKNGKEIYEDDIIKWDRGGGAGVNWVVKWGYSGWDIYLLPIEGEPESEIRLGCSLDKQHVNGCEVIGNIYENPELLTAKSA